MRKAEHILHLSFDQEYQEKYSAWKDILRMYIEIEIEYLFTPKNYIPLTPASVFLSVVISSGQLWWLGLIAGITFTILISLSVTASMLWEERRKLGLDIVLPW